MESAKRNVAGRSSRPPFAMVAGLLLVIGSIVAGASYGIVQMQRGLDQMYAMTPPEPEPTAAAPAETLAKRPIVGNPAHGKQLFSMSCNVCHGPTGAGVPALGANLRMSKFIAGHSDQDLIAFIKIGRQPGDPNTVMNGTMPPKGGNPMLDDPMLQDVVAFLRTLQMEQATSSTAGAAASVTPLLR